jgi:hypothetical protein
MGKPHDIAAKRQARTVYSQHGAQAAADTTGISVRSIRRWASTERWPRRLTVADPSPKKMAARSQAAMLGWHTRRRHMADTLGQVGAQVLEAIQQDLSDRKRLNLRDAAILLGVVVDKAELLTAVAGGVGSLEAMSDTDRLERVRTIVDDLQQRAEADQDG